MRGHRRGGRRAGGAMAKRIKQKARAAAARRPVTGRTAAIYVRVSSDEQTTANQLPDCRKLAAARGWRVVEVYEDDGVQGDARKRPGLERALLDAHRGHFKLLVVWALDRLSRDGARRALRI